MDQHTYSCINKGISSFDGIKLGILYLPHHLYYFKHKIGEVRSANMQTLWQRSVGRYLWLTWNTGG